MTARRNSIEHPPDRTSPPAGAAAEADVIAEAVRVVTRSGCSYLVVRSCPFCGKRHAHGATGPHVGDGDGWRVAHCFTGDSRPQYFVREVEAAQAGGGKGATQ